MGDEETQSLKQCLESFLSFISNYLAFITFNQLSCMYSNYCCYVHYTLNFSWILIGFYLVVSKSNLCFPFSLVYIALDNQFFLIIALKFNNVNIPPKCFKVHILNDGQNLLTWCFVQSYLEKPHFFLSMRVR